MKGFILLCFVCLLSQMIFAFEFEDNCHLLGGPVFAEKNGWARIGCKTDDWFGYCTLKKKNPPLTCDITIRSNYQAEIVDCKENARIRFTGNAQIYTCEFEIKNLQQDGKKL